jgi:predicted RNase H-like nuclease
VRSVLKARSYEEACELSRTSSKHDTALSKQTWGILPKSKEVDDLIKRSIIREVHPELCFCELAGAPMEFAKSKPEGRADRQRLWHVTLTWMRLSIRANAKDCR